MQQQHQPQAQRPRAKLQKTAKKPPRNLALTILKWGSILAVSGAALLVATVAFVYWMYSRDPNLPDYRKLADYKPKQVTQVLDSNDRRIGEIGEKRTFVEYKQIPPIVIDAFVAAEDNRFWTHGGVDYTGMFRAFITNLRSGRAKQGASTITQQVVKTFLLTPEKTFKRKLQEIILARRLEKALTKEEIMTLYVNQIYFGHQRYGIQEAARYYFGKSVEQLDAGEAAVLASMPKKPEDLANALFGRKGGKPEEVKARQIYVLNQLVAIGKLPREDAQKYIDQPIKIVKSPFPEMGSAPEWVTLAEEQLIKDKGKDAIDTLGSKVRTTLDPGLQTLAQTALQTALRKVDGRQKIGKPSRSIKGKLEPELAKLAKQLPSGGPKAREIYDAIVTGVHDDDNVIVVDLGGYKASLELDDARFNPENKKPSERFKDGDVVDVVTASGEGKHAKHRVDFPAPPQGAVVILETKTRKVRAMVGGYSFTKGDRNRALYAKRQPGSSFKPFVYGAAIDSGKYTAASIVNDAPEVFDLWRPKNYESGKFEGPVTLRHALAKSINTVAIRLAYDLKPETIAAFAKKLGIQSELPKEMSLALGSGEVTPLEMTNAIATLAAGGVYAPPRFVDAIDGKALPTTASEQVLRPEVAYVITQMMTSVVTEGTGTAANALKIPIAGKTGTSNEGRDVWFMGFTPDYVIGVWVGYDQPRPMSKETGGSTAVPVFVDIMKGMSPGAKPFVKPAHVVEASIDKVSGLLSPEGAPKSSARTEYFVEGSAPTEYAAKPGDVTDDNVVTGEYAD